MPKFITVEMAQGLTLYMVKAVMRGGGDGVIAFDHSNLWR